MSSSIRSWLSPSRSPRPDRAAYELPLYNSTMPATAFPPPPITASMMTTAILSPSGPSKIKTPGRLASPPNVSDDMLILQRRERELQNVLQDLLDSQAEGLIAGLGADAGSDIMSNGGITPTSSIRDARSSVAGNSSPHARSRMLSPRPKRKLGLGSARKEIYRRILECAAIKVEEDRLIQADTAFDQEVLHRLQSWEEKRGGLTARIAQIENDDSAGERMESMRSEALTLSNEISELETRLVQLRQRHKGLETQMAELSNQTDCELASWKSSLGMLDKDIDRFLAHPPIRRDRTADDAGSTPFMTLPVHRRTLAMAREHWQASTSRANKQRKLIRRERKALEEGAVVWRAVVAGVTGFERVLRAEMSSSAAGDALHTIAKAMDTVIENVEAHFETARTKKWNLLVVAIGGELEALKQGRDMLRQSILANADLLQDDLGTTQNDGQQSPSTKKHVHQRTRSVMSRNTNGGLEESSIGGVAVPRTPTARTLSKSPQAQIGGDEEQNSSPPLAELAALNPHSATLHESMYEDEDPDPELLIGKATDTETDED